MQGISHSEPMAPDVAARRASDSDAIDLDAVDLDATELERDHAELRRGTRLQRIHWVTVAASLAVTLVAWQYSHGLVAGRSAERFERERVRLADAVLERFARYEDLLRAAAAALASHGGDMPDARWRLFADELGIDARYPEISTLAVAAFVPAERIDRFVARQRRGRAHFDVHPRTGRDESLVITHVEPAAEMRHALGLDLRHEPERSAAIDAAREAGEPRITAPVDLVRREGRAPGLVFVMPLYDPAGAFSGAVVAPFALDEIASGTLARDDRRVGVRIVDAGETLLDELGPQDPGFDARPLHEAAFELEVYGRTWQLEVATDASFRADAGLATPRAVLAAGLAVDAALLWLFVVLSRRRARALAYADRAVAALRGRMTALAASNAELEGFAHVVSHDLKTPVRGIGDLVEYLAEDLEGYLGSPDAAPEVGANLERLDAQHRRLTHLIDSVLAYSALGREHVASGTLDARAVLESLARELGLDDERLRIRGARPVFRTHPVRFEQVMRNLLDNALTHFEGDSAGLRVEIVVAAVPGGWSFEVGDNGPGIPERFHGAVFDVFRRLRPKDEVEGSGIGLSIVRRSVETLGGSVALRSSPGEGCTFELFWPEEPAPVAPGRSAARLSA